MAEPPKTFRVLGADLALTRFTGTASSLGLETADSWGSLDLRTAPGGRGSPRPGAAAALTDLGVVAGRENLGQALILRLLTPVGALAPLGHPDYGSRLVELIGRLNDVTTRNLARLFTLQALAAEPRVAQVLDLAVTVTPDRPDAVRMAFAVLPLDNNQPLALTLEIAL